MAGKADFDAARDRLVATGMFETVGYKFAPGADGHGYAASFQVIEAQPAYAIRFTNLGVTDKDLTAYLKTKDPLFAPRLAATKEVMARYKQWIQEYVTAHGSKDTVIAKVTPTGPDEFVILFRPARSEPSVAQVSFTGNETIPESKLQNTIAEVAVGVPYHEDSFRQLLDASIRPLYDARGRLRVAFTKVTVEKAPDVDGLAVHVTIEEGTTYNLGDVRIQGGEHFEPARLLKTAKFKRGTLADFDEINNGVDRIRKMISHEGYMRNDIKIARHIDDQKKIVNVVLEIDEGPQFLFGKLTVDGLDLDGEAAIRKMWTHESGTPYNPDYPDYFLKRVHEEGMFDNLGETRAETKINDKTRIVDVTLYFKYAPTPVNRKKTQPF
jgi:outer membrane protein insertion porin family